METNKDNEALMTFTLSTKDPNYEIKARQLGITADEISGYGQFGFDNPDGNDEGAAKRDYQIPIQYREKKVKEAFSFLRVIKAKGNEFLIISSADGLRLDDIPPISIRNEIDVLNTLSLSAKESLNKFETTLEFDNEILKDERLLLHRRNSVLMRRGEKEVLHFYIKLKDICIPLFEMNYTNLRDKLNKEDEFKNDSNSALMQYINFVVIPLVQRASRNRRRRRAINKKQSV